MKFCSVKFPTMLSKPIDYSMIKPQRVYVLLGAQVI